MGFLNKVILLGNLTRNPEVRYIPGSNTAVARFGLAVNRRYKQNNETKEETCFIDIVSFGRLAEFAGEYLVKGMSILIEGRLSFNTWEQEGVKRNKHEIISENIQLVWKKETNSMKQSDPSDKIKNTIINSSGTATNSDDINEDDIPF